MLSHELVHQSSPPIRLISNDAYFGGEKFYYTLSQARAVQIQFGERACDPNFPRKGHNEDFPQRGGETVPQGRRFDLQRRGGRGRAESRNVKILGSESRHVRREYAHQLLQVRDLE